MWLIRGIVGCALGGLLGAIIWSIVAHSLHVELYIIAMLVAALAGVGMRLGAREQICPLTGIVAGLVAIGAMLGGKQLAIEYAAQDAIARIDFRNVWAIADEVAYEWEIVEGRELDWPYDADPDYRYSELWYPVDVWDEAEYRYRSLTPTEQTDLEAYPFFAVPRWQTAVLAKRLLVEWEYEELNWDDVVESVSPRHEEEFPAELWDEAEYSWEQMTDMERDDLEYETCLRWEEMNVDLMDALDEAKREAFRSTFGIRDFMWIGLGFLIAAGIGGNWME